MRIPNRVAVGFPPVQPVVSEWSPYVSAGQLRIWIFVELASELISSQNVVFVIANSFEQEDVS